MALRATRAAALATVAAGTTGGAAGRPAAGAAVGAAVGATGATAARAAPAPGWSKYKAAALARKATGRMSHATSASWTSGVAATSFADATHAWHVVDATDEVVGRFAARVARLLQGKHKPTYTANRDEGDFVVVVNAAKVRFTGNKFVDKRYYWHTQWAGGLRSASPRDVAERDNHPDRIISHAVSGMLPKNNLRDARLRRLKVYPGSAHDHVAQFPRLSLARAPEGTGRGAAKKLDQAKP